MYLTQKPLDGKFRDILIKGQLYSTTLLVDRFEYFANIPKDEIGDVDWDILSQAQLMLVKYVHGDISLESMLEDEATILRLIDASSYLATSQSFTNYLISQLRFILDLEYYSTTVGKLTKCLGNEKFLLNNPKMTIDHYLRLAPVLSLSASEMIAQQYHIGQTNLICYDRSMVFGEVPKGRVVMYSQKPSSSIITSLTKKFLPEDQDIYFSSMIPTPEIIGDIINGTEEAIKSMRHPEIAVFDPKLSSILISRRFKISLQEDDYIDRCHCYMREFEEYKTICKALDSMHKIHHGVELGYGNDPEVVRKICKALDSNPEYTP
jgi:hypothetical protein